MDFRIVAFLLLAGCATGQVILERESGVVSAFFCDQIDCEKAFMDLAKNSSLDCAMYHPTESIARAVLERGALVVDGRHKVEGAVIESGSGLMHNKFCVINGSVVWTGSWNPNQGMSIPNNVVVLESKTLARAFKAEFEELQNGVFQRGKRGSAQVLLNGNVTEVYFCPEDGCKRRILEVLEESEVSVHVMAYSFTDDDIGALLKRKGEEGLDVRVVFDPRKDDKSSEYPKLREHAKIAKVHHKVFIVDGEAVILGSMNPTRSGDEQNDENIVVVREAGVVRAFEEEFGRLWFI